MQASDHVDVVVVGAGLAGLSLARHLVDRGQSVTVLEGRGRAGGRILTVEESGAGFDLGPAWFWPGQPRIAELISRLGLRHFEQFADGDLLYQDERGLVQRGRGYASMAGSLRVDGGLARLTDTLAASLPVDTVRYGAEVEHLRRKTDGVDVATTEGRTFHAKRVSLALPPRLAADLTFSPPLSIDAVQQLRGIPTWMAGQAKAVAVYETPFWRTHGLSGDAMSRRGPMVEIHDASVADGGPYALFGFIGVPARGRSDRRLVEAGVLKQLADLFGPEARNPVAVHFKDWATDTFTATAQDADPLYHHPAYGMPKGLETLWNGRLMLSGTEVAATFGGFLEGALEAAEIAAERLDKERQFAR